MLLVAFVTLISLPGSRAACSVGELFSSPGHRYRVERIQQFVDSAEVVVRAKAVATLPDSGFWTRIRFEVLERLRASDSLTNVVLRGRVTDQNDFNLAPVPYQMVRPSGTRGDCDARQYRLGAEYLLILRATGEGLSPHWKALAPLNEQVTGADDAWVEWVRVQLRRSR